jgi:hypothetical protein
VVESVPDNSTSRIGAELLKRYAILGYGAFGTMADVGLMVLGSLLVGLALAVLIGGFGLSRSPPRSCRPERC